MEDRFRGGIVDSEVFVEVDFQDHDNFFKDSIIGELINAKIFTSC